MIILKTVPPHSVCKIVVAEEGQAQMCHLHLSFQSLVAIMHAMSNHMPINMGGLKVGLWQPVGAAMALTRKKKMRKRGFMIFLKVLSKMRSQWQMGFQLQG
jgi:thiamine phosphate synthase YjbQ (UPF0047 family)